MRHGTQDRRLRDDRRLPDGRAGGPRRVDRLALRSRGSTRGPCFAALLGTPENGRWRIAPAGTSRCEEVRRRYRPGTLVLETEFTTDSGTVRLIDAMAIDSDYADRGPGRRGACAARSRCGRS